MADGGLSVPLIYKLDMLGVMAIWREGGADAAAPPAAGWSPAERRQAERVARTLAVAAALERRDGAADAGPVARLAADPRVPLDGAALEALLARPEDFTGTAIDQVARVVARADEIFARHPEAAATAGFGFVGSGDNAPRISALAAAAARATAGVDPGPGACCFFSVRSLRCCSTGAPTGRGSTGLIAAARVCFSCAAANPEPPPGALATHTRGRASAASRVP